MSRLPHYGLVPPGGWSPVRGFPSRRKLTEEQVAQIKRLALDGVRTIVLAAHFGCSTGHIRAIQNGTSWGWVQPADVAEPIPGGAR